MNNDDLTTSDAEVDGDGLVYNINVGFLGLLCFLCGLVNLCTICKLVLGGLGVSCGSKTSTGAASVPVTTAGSPPGSL